MRENRDDAREVLRLPREAFERPKQAGPRAISKDSSRDGLQQALDDGLWLLKIGFEQTQERFGRGLRIVCLIRFGGRFSYAA